MRFIALAAFLATCQVVCGQFAPEVKAYDSFVASTVSAVNKLIAPIAPFGRKLTQDLLTAAETAQVVKGNAIGSLFYVPGQFFNPTTIGEAITGVVPSGRKLKQTGYPDPYGFIPKANLVASVLTGNIVPGYTGRKMQETEEKEAQWDVEAIHQALGYGAGANRKLQQDTLAANYLGSVVVGAVTLYDEALHLPTPTGRKLLDYRVGYGFPQGTGSLNVQEAALASAAANPTLLLNGVTDRNIVLGFQSQEGKRKLLNDFDHLEHYIGSVLHPVPIDPKTIHAALGWKPENPVEG